MIDKQEIFESQYLGEVAYDIIMSKGWALYKMFDGLRGFGFHPNYIIEQGKSKTFNEFQGYLILPFAPEPYDKDKDSLSSLVSNANAPPCYVDFEGSPTPETAKILGVYPIESVWRDLNKIEYRLANSAVKIEVDNKNLLQSLIFNLNPYRVKKLL